MYRLNSTDIRKVSGGILLNKDGGIFTIGISGDEVFRYKYWYFSKDEYYPLYADLLSADNVFVLNDFDALPDSQSWEACDVVYVMNTN